MPYLAFHRNSRAWLLVACVFSLCVFLWGLFVEAATIQQYRDRISDSGPGVYANHTIEFKTTTPLPPLSTIRIIPHAGSFEIPTDDFGIDNVELHVKTTGSYQKRDATSTVSATEDAIMITPGTSGMIELVLNTTEGIPANALIKVLIGNHTELATSTDRGIKNPIATGTYPIYIETDTGTNVSRVRGLIAIVDKVTVGPIDTREFDPPFRFNGAPSGILSGTVTAVEVSLETDEFAKCRYSFASNTPYFSMGNEFHPYFTVLHRRTFPVATSITYTFYVRCIDDEGNVNNDDYVISFSIPDFPAGTPGDSGSNEGTGSGTGQGSGAADPGAGDPAGGDTASGGTTGGGGGGGSGGGSGPSSGGSGGGGGFEGADRPYQSGDARVVISGYAFPRSQITVLVDGKVVLNTTSNAGGEFSAVIDQIARGVYTFGVYGTDPAGVRSSTFATTFSVAGSRASSLTNINVMPSLRVSPDPVTPGQTLTVSGYTLPNATVTIENMRDKTPQSLKTFTTTSSANGQWSLQISTTGFSIGTYKVRARAVQSETISTQFSDYMLYGVGQAAERPRTADLNRDGKVNLIDFSILLFWWNTDGGNSNPPADINGDGRVSLTDFSIMVFNWTG